MSLDKPSDTEELFPDVLTRDQVRFEVSFALHEVAKSTVWEWARNNRMKKETAWERIVDTVLARFDRLQVRGPAAAVSLFQDRVLRWEDDEI